MFRMVMFENLGWEMDTSITRESDEMLIRVDENWGEISIAVC